MKKLIITLILLVCLYIGVAFAKTGFDMGMGLGSGGTTVTGPVTSGLQWIGGGTIGWIGGGDVQPI